MRTMLPVVSGQPDKTDHDDARKCLRSDGRNIARQIHAVNDQGVDAGRQSDLRAPICRSVNQLSHSVDLYLNSVNAHIVFRGPS